MKPLVAFVLALACVGCGTRACKPKTALITVDYGALGANVDSVQVQLAYPGDTPTSTTLAHAAGVTTGSFEIDFGSGYQAGGTLLVTVDAFAGGVLVGSASDSIALASSCTATRLTLSATSGDTDGGSGDLGGDGGTIGDMNEPPADLTGLVFPSNVSTAYLNASTADWTVTSASSINTDGTDVASAFTPAPPGGVIYAVDGSFAVVAVHNLTVAANVALRATGSRPLIIVAGGTIVVNGVIDGGARGVTPGPGGGAPGVGLGHGGNGDIIEASEVVLISGGGGAGYGSAGADGGTIPATETPTGAAGATYGTPTLTPPVGGSGGGIGGTFSCSPAPPAGAGGGFLQLSARASITVAPYSVLGSVPSGVVSVGGGGGSGCANIAGGAGGGSGGSLLIESPSLSLHGLIGAAGGGGGSGSTNGSDGLAITNAAASSIGGAPTGGQNNSGGSGSNGITATSTAQPGAAGVAGTTMAGPVGSGGGGGGFGRIYIRANGTPTLTMSTPTPTFDPTLPSKIP